jgi:hypothetical protein
VPETKFALTVVNFRVLFEKKISSQLSFEKLIHFPSDCFGDQFQNNLTYLDMKSYQRLRDANRIINKQKDYA